QSYQPPAVTDALLALSLASEADLRVHSIDVNPRVVRALDAAARAPITLRVFTGIVETADQPFTPEYRAYVRALGRAIGEETTAPRDVASDKHYQHSIAVRASVARALSAQRLNIVTERLVDEPPFDIAVATNVLTYFDDTQLALALANIAAMLRPGGYLIHNESRAGLTDAASAVGLPLVHQRTAILGGPHTRPLYDTVWGHQKTATPRGAPREQRSKGLDVKSASRCRRRNVPDGPEREPFRLRSRERERATARPRRSAAARRRAGERPSLRRALGRRSLG